MAGALIQVDILGLRNLQGRFAKMVDYEMREIQMAAAEELADGVKHVYQANAPRGRTDKFMESLDGAAQWTGHGFLVEITTGEPQLRKWLAEGTGIFGPTGQRIYPTNSSVMVWEGENGELVFAASTAGMPPNDWEVYANLEAAPLILLNGNKIGSEIVTRLAGGV